MKMAFLLSLLVPSLAMASLDGRLACAFGKAQVVGMISGGKLGLIAYTDVEGTYLPTGDSGMQFTEDPMRPREVSPGVIKYLIYEKNSGDSCVLQIAGLQKGRRADALYSCTKEGWLTVTRGPIQQGFCTLQ